MDNFLLPVLWCVVGQYLDPVESLIFRNRQHWKPRRLALKQIFTFIGQKIVTIRSDEEFNYLEDFLTALHNTWFREWDKEHFYIDCSTLPEERKILSLCSPYSFIKKLHEGFDTRYLYQCSFDQLEPRNQKFLQVHFGEERKSCCFAKRDHHFIARILEGQHWQCLLKVLDDPKRHSYVRTYLIRLKSYEQMAFLVKTILTHRVALLEEIGKWLPFVQLDFACGAYYSIINYLQAPIQFPVRSVLRAAQQNSFLLPIIVRQYVLPDELMKRIISVYLCSKYPMIEVPPETVECFLPFFKIADQEEMMDWIQLSSKFQKYGILKILIDKEGPLQTWWQKMDLKWKFSLPIYHLFEKTDDLTLFQTKLEILKQENHISYRRIEDDIYDRMTEKWFFPHPSRYFVVIELTKWLLEIKFRIPDVIIKYLFTYFPNRSTLKQVLDLFYAKQTLRLVAVSHQLQNPGIHKLVTAYLSLKK